MARLKNAKTGYFIAPIPVSGEPEYVKLAKWITAVSDDSEDETEDSGDYAGDGSKRTDVTGRKEAYTFEGTYDGENDAMKLVYSKKRTPGDRAVMFKIERADGSSLEGEATLSDIVAGEGGGEATEYPEFKTSVTFDSTPTEKAAPAPAAKKGGEVK